MAGEGVESQNSAGAKGPAEFTEKNFGRFLIFPLAVFC